MWPEKLCMLQIVHYSIPIIDTNIKQIPLKIGEFNFSFANLKPPVFNSICYYSIQYVCIYVLSYKRFKACTISSGHTVQRTIYK